MGEIKDLLERINDEINILNNLVPFLKCMQKYENELPNKYRVTNISTSILITELKTIEDFKIVIKWLKKCFGKIKYQQKTIWSSCGKILCSWVIKDIPITIWLETLPQDFPKELIRKGCKIKKVEPYVEEQYVYTCEI